MTPSGKQTIAPVLIRLPLDAEVLAHYEGMAQFAHRPVEEVLADQLTRFKTHDIRDRVLALTPIEREKLEELIELISI